MDTEELLYDIKRKLDEVTLKHQYNNIEKEHRWTNEDLRDLIKFMRDDYYRLHHEATNKVFNKFLIYKERIQ